MRQPTPLYEVVQHRLGRSLEVYVAEARKARRSWRTIATDLSAVSGTTVSWETLRAWFGEAEDREDEPATDTAATA